MNLGISKKAMLCVAFFFSQVSVAKTEPKTETVASTIERAHNLVLQNERQQAVSLLYRALKRESPKSNSYAELKRNIEELSTVFLSDQAQQLFEVAISLRKADVQQAHQKIQEALKIEPDNTQLIAEQIRVLILKNECPAAQDLVRKNIEANSLDEQLKLLEYQSAICLQKAQEEPESPALLPAVVVKRSGPQAFFWILADLEKAHKELKAKQAAELLAQLKKLDPSAPQIDFWKYKLESNKKTVLSQANKYLMACKNMTASQFRRYILDVMLCRNLGDLENEIKTIQAGADQ